MRLIGSLVADQSALVPTIMIDLERQDVRGQIFRPISVLTFVSSDP